MWEDGGDGSTPATVAAGQFQLLPGNTPFSQVANPSPLHCLVPSRHACLQRQLAINLKIVAVCWRYYAIVVVCVFYGNWHCCDSCCFLPFCYANPVMQIMLSPSRAEPGRAGPSLLSECNGPSHYSFIVAFASLLFYLFIYSKFTYKFIFTEGSLPRNKRDTIRFFFFVFFFALFGRA